LEPNNYALAVNLLGKIRKLMGICCINKQELSYQYFDYFFHANDPNQHNGVIVELYLCSLLKKIKREIIFSFISFLWPFRSNRTVAITTAMIMAIAAAAI